MLKPTPKETEAACQHEIIAAEDADRQQEMHVPVGNCGTRFSDRSAAGMLWCDEWEVSGGLAHRHTGTEKRGQRQRDRETATQWRQTGTKAKQPQKAENDKWGSSVIR